MSEHHKSQRKGHTKHKNMIPDTMDETEFWIYIAVFVVALGICVFICFCTGKFLILGIIIAVFVALYFGYMWLYRDKP